MNSTDPINKVRSGSSIRSVENIDFFIENHIEISTDILIEISIDLFSKSYFATQSQTKENAQYANTEA